MNWKFNKDDIRKAIEQAAMSAAGTVSTAYRNAVADLAKRAEAQLYQLAGQRLNTTRQQYQDAITFEVVEKDVYRISLDESAEHLETGYPPFSMKDGLLKNAKISKKGYKYKRIPFDHQPNAKTGNNTQVQHMWNVLERQAAMLGNQMPGAVGKYTKGSLRADIQHMLKSAKNAGISTSGNVTFKPDPLNTNNMIVDSGQGTDASPRVDLGKPMNPLLTNMKQVSYQDKKGRNKKAYVTFRTVSNNPEAQGKWEHPGWVGARFFPEVAAWVDQELERILRDL